MDRVPPADPSDRASVGTASDIRDRAGEGAPRVSVICIFLNEERFLAEAVDSVLAQTFQNFELILVDDGSTDASTAIARDLERRHPGRIRYAEHPGHENRGMSATRNLGLRLARGEFVAVMDGDDRWRTNKLADQVAILDAHPDVGMACGAYNLWQSWCGGEDEVFISGPVANAATYPPASTLRVYPLGRSCNPTDPMVRREIALRVGGYDEDFRGLYEDQAFLSRIYLETGVFWSTTCWLDYRRHPASCTAQVDEVIWRATRRRFLDRFEGYVAARQDPGRDDILKAITRARWSLDHPGIGRWISRFRRLYLLAAKSLGMRDFFARRDPVR